MSSEGQIIKELCRENGCELERKTPRLYVLGGWATEYESVLIDALREACNRSPISQITKYERALDAMPRAVSVKSNELKAT